MRSLVAVEKVQCGGKDYLVDRANLLVYDFEDGLNEVLDPEPVRPNPQPTLEITTAKLKSLSKRWRRSSRKMSVAES